MAIFQRVCSISTQTGNHRRCPVTWSQCLTAATVACALLLLGGSAASAAPPLPLAPHDLPGDLGALAAAGNQENPGIARGGPLYLVAWTDDRTSIFDSSGESGSARDVYAARLDAEGNVIDTTPIVIDQSEQDQYGPTVVWNGSSWLVIYTGTVPYGPLYHRVIQAVRVSPVGEVLDPEPILIWDGGTTDDIYGDHLLGAASDGNNWAVILSDEYSDGFGIKFRLVGKRVTANGSVLGTQYLYSPSCCSFFYLGGVAYAGGIYMAVFEGYVDSFNYGIFGLRMSSSLATLDSYPVVLTQIAMQSETHFYRTPGVAGGNDMFYVGWQLYISDTSSQIYGARVGVNGQSLDGNGVPISDPGPLDLHLSPALTWDGTQWIAGWDAGSLAMARISAAGTVLDPGGVMQSLPPSTSFAGTGTGGAQVAWSEARVSDPMPLDVFTARVSASLDVGPDMCASLGAPSQTQADLAAGTTGQMLVYRSAISGERRIMAHPVDASGEAMTPEPVQLATGSVNDPRVAYDGENYLVVWSDDSTGEIRGSRLAQDGTVLDASPLSLMDGADPDVAGRSGQFLVAANQAASALAVRVDADGTVIDATPLVVRSSVAGAPRAAVLGAYWLVAYEYTSTPDGAEIEFKLIDSGGGTLGPFPVSAAGDGVAAHRPAVAAGDSALVMWQDDRAAADDLNLYGRRLSASVTFADPPAGVAIVTASGNQSAAAVAWDGTQFLTAFTDDRNVVNTIDVRTDIYRNWLPAFGLVSSEEGLPLFSDSVPEIDAAVSALDGNSLYAASVFSSGSPHAAYRIQLRFAGLPTDVGRQPHDSVQVTRLLSAYPNPANPAVEISFRLAQEGAATVEIFDVRGARVRTLRAQNLSAGQHQMLWDGTNEAGRAVPSGTYLYRLRAGGAEDVGKLMLVQ